MDDARKGRAASQGPVGRYLVQVTWGGVRASVLVLALVLVSGGVEA